MAHDRNWLTFEEALAYSGRSPATLRRAISAGKIAKKAVSVPGRRPEVHLSREDLTTVFTSSVHTPAVIATDHNRVNGSDQTALVPAPNGNLPVALERIAEVLTQWPVASGQWPVVELRHKLTWTMREARTMTGLSLPALRELVEAHPDLAVRRGRRVWIKAGKLRDVLG